MFRARNLTSTNPNSSGVVKITAFTITLLFLIFIYISARIDVFKSTKNCQARWFRYERFKSWFDSNFRKTRGVELCLLWSISFCQIVLAKDGGNGLFLCLIVTWTCFAVNYGEEGAILQQLNTWGKMRWILTKAGLFSPKISCIWWYVDLMQSLEPHIYIYANPYRAHFFCKIAVLCTAPVLTSASFRFLSY